MDMTDTSDLGMHTRSYDPSSPPQPKPARKPSWRDNVVTTAALMRKHFPPIKWVVPDLIPEGLTLLCGKPKVCKSWMALDIGLSIAAGRFCLGDKKPVQGDVLYCALEDNERRLKWRTGKLLDGAPAPEGMTLATAWRRLDKGGVQDIAEWLDEHPNARLVILDTLAGVKPIKTQQGYTEDYASLEQLHRLANDRGVAIVVIHHLRKMEAEDPVDAISGTLGLAGCADTLAIIARNSQGTTLYLRGRDIQEAEHAISFGKDTCKWTILGDASEVRRSSERGKILAVLHDAADLVTPQEIIVATGMTKNNVDQLLFKMAAAGEVAKEGRGKYRHPDRLDLTPGKFDKSIRNQKNTNEINDDED